LARWEDERSERPDDVSFLSHLSFIARRSLSHWRLLSTVVLGVLLATTVMASSVIYFDSLGDLALRRELEGFSQEALDVLVNARLSPVDQVGHDGLSRTVEQTADRHIGWLLSEPEQAFKSSTFYVVDEDRYVDITDLVGPGANTVTYYHFEDDRLGLKLRVSRPPSADSSVSPPRIDVEETELELITRHDAPTTWTVDLPDGFNKVEIGIYRKGRTAVAKYAGWDGWLKVNGSLVWESRRVDLGEDVVVYDHLLGAELPLDTSTSEDMRAFFMVVPTLSEHAVLTSGRWPTPVASRASDGPLTVEAVLPREAADEFGLEPGDTLTVAPFWQDDHGEMDALIVGVYRWRGPTPSFWDRFEEAFYLADEGLQFAPLTVREEAFVGAIGPYYPKMDASHAWWFGANTGVLHASDGAAALAEFDALHDELARSVDGYSQRTAVPGVLERGETRLVYNRLPMTIVLFLLVAVVLYYVAILSALLVSAQRNQIGLLSSRSATYPQIVGVFAVEALCLAVVGVAAGPLLAAGAVHLIGAVPLFEDLNAGLPLPARVTGAAYLVALLGGGLSFVALVVPAARTAREGLLEQTRAATRPVRLPAFQRYYLDVTFLGMILLLFWQLSRQGSFVTRGILDETSIDQISLALPAMVLVVAGFALLRLFPLSMDLLSRALAARSVGRAVPPVVLLGLWQMARNPGRYSRLSLLVILTAGLGVFVSSFASTLDRGARERALFESGAALRVIGTSYEPRERLEAAVDAVEAVPGVSDVAPVFRTFGVDITAGVGQTFDFLAAEPSTFGRVAWSRSDFTSEPFADTLALLDVGGSGIVIPEDARWLTALVKPRDQRDHVNLVARLSDAGGHLYSLNLGNPFRSAPADGAFTCAEVEPESPAEWCRLAGDLQELQEAVIPPEMPLRLEFIGVGVFAYEPPRRFSRRGPNVSPGTIDIDDIATTSESGDVSVLEPFDDVSKWETAGLGMNDFGTRLEQLEGLDGEPVSGIASLAWTAAYPRELQGVLLRPEAAAVPVLASASFAGRAAHSLGDVWTVTVLERKVPVQLVGVVDYFPTLNPSRSAFIVAGMRGAWRAFNADRLGSSEQISELWIDAEPGKSDGVARELRENGLPYTEILARDALLESARIDPLVSAGWSALLAITFFTALAVSGVGFLMHVQATLVTRRAELALLTTIGLSIRQFLGLVFLEQGLVIVPAVAIGAFAGARIGATIMPYLGTSGEGLKLVPPMILEMDWGALGTVFGMVGAVFCTVAGGGVIALWLSVRRMSVRSVLRLEEQ